MRVACARLTQLCAAVVADDPGKHRILGEIVHAAVGEIVEMQQVLIVGDVTSLPLQHVALRRVLRDMVLCHRPRQVNTFNQVMRLQKWEIRGIDDIQSIVLIK